MNRRTYSRLWVPTLLVALVTILCFAFVSRYQNIQVRQGNELNMQAMAVVRDVDRVLAAMMQGVTTGNDAYFVDAARVSRDLEEVVHELVGSGLLEQEDLWITYRELYRNLVAAVALFQEHRNLEATLAMETVQHLESQLRVRLEQLSQRVGMNQARMVRTMNLIMAVAALLLLATALINGLFFVPALVVRPMQRMVEKAESASEALRNEQLRLEAITGSAHDALVMMAPDETIVFWNPSAERLFGYSHDQALGRSLHHLLAPERYHALFSKALPRFQATGQGDAVGKTLELEGRRADGSEVPIELSLSAVQLSSGWHAVGMMRDITERKEAEEKLRRFAEQMEMKNIELDEALTRAEAATQAKSEFLANMSHEIRTPMNGVIGMTGLLLDTDLDETQRRYAEIVRSSGEALLNLINDILDFSKIESGKLELESLDFGLRPMLDNFTAMMAFKAEEKGLEFICAADPDVPDRLTGDPGRLRQILTNLAGNAVKFTEQGEVVVRVQRTERNSGMLEYWNAGIEEVHGSRFNGSAVGEIADDGAAVGVTRGRPSFDTPNAPSPDTTPPPTVNPEPLNREPHIVELCFTIRDTGIGIPADKVGDLFQSFTQVDASITRKFGGTGLGLAISKQLAEMMGGEVGLESIEGQGSTFWFTVRLQQAKPMESLLPKPADLHNVRTLVVDDNATNREILLTRFLGWGMRPDEAPDGPTALGLLYKAQAEGDPYRMAVLDMQMPGMDGETLGRVIQADPRLQPLRTVMLTSLGQRGDAKRLQEAGFAAYLTKPVLHGELFDTLTLVLAKDDKAASQDLITRHRAREAAGGRKSFTPRKARILLAEDNPTNQQVALAILKNLGLSADAVANGAEAVQAIQTIPYDLVLMDVQMPVMDGLAATREIRKAEGGKSKDEGGGRKDEGSSADSSALQPSAFSPHPSHRRLPIIALTAHAMQGYREQCLSAGMDDYLTKPLEPGQLAEMLEKWLPIREDGDQTAEGDSRKEEEGRRKEEGGSPVAEVGTLQDRAALRDDEAPAINKAEFVRRMDGDEEMAGQILDGFVDTNTDRLKTLFEAIDQGDTSGVREHAHAIKGSSLTISAGALARAAGQLEQAGKDGDVAACRDLGSNVEREFERLCLELGLE